MKSKNFSEELREPGNRDGEPSRVFLHNSSRWILGAYFSAQAGGRMPAGGGGEEGK